MFGYIKPHTPEMRVREYELYRGIYCGLCRSMGKHTGCLSRMTLSYDFVFLALIRMTVEHAPRTLENHRCLPHLIRGRKSVSPSDALAYCAKAAAILSCEKVRDDIADSRRLRKLLARFALVPAAMAERRTALPDLEESIRRALRRLTEQEAVRSPSVDTVADIFGELLGEVCAYGIAGEREQRILREIGVHTGRLIYVLDAADDLPEDAKSGNYNPFIALYGASGLDAERADAVKTAMNCELQSLERAIRLLDYSDCRELEPIMENILYLGMPHECDRVLKKYTSNQNSTEEPAEAGVDTIHD